jgi:uncharacterized protein YcbK (DUF882 family)
MREDLTVGDLSSHFSEKEFTCKDLCGFTKPSTKLIEVLEKIRAQINQPIYITPNGGCRCKAQNKKVGGARRSQHLQGKAADIYVKGLPAKELAFFIEKVIPYTGGIGLYKTFVHVDVRWFRARWRDL